MSTYIVEPCPVCKQDNARPYCTMNENWRTCAKHSQYLANELAKANRLIQQLVEGSELLFDDLRSLRSSRICDAIDNAKNYLRSK
jgi:hypothetical protein